MRVLLQGQACAGEGSIGPQTFGHVVEAVEGVQKKHYRQLIDEPLRKVKEQGHQQLTPLTKQQMVSCLFKIGSSVSGVGYCRKQRITGPISIDARA